MTRKYIAFYRRERAHGLDVFSAALTALVMLTV
jgi:hypothetical protein